MEELAQSETIPPFCATGCGFYANPKTGNLCYRCHNSVLEKEAKEASIHSNLVVNNVADERPLENHHNGVEVVKKKNRCQVCNKRVGLVAFSCRCGHSFCGLHRMPEEHECGFDFKAVGRAVLKEHNPVCVAPKLENRL